jgi:hypothetical protein
MREPGFRGRGLDGALPGWNDPPGKKAGSLKCLNPSQRETTP